MWAKQSTAATLIVGPILDSTGAEYTSAVIGDLSLSKNGGTLTALASAASLTHIANGQYTLVLTTGNTDTLGRAQITCNKATYQMPEMRLMVVPAMVFDSLVLGTDVLQGDVVQIGGVTQSATDLKDFADTGYNPATHKVQGVVLVDTTTTNTDMRGTNNAMLAVSYTAPPSAATISTQVASDLAAAHGAGSWATATGFSTHSASDVLSALGTGSWATSLASQSSVTQIVNALPTSGHLTGSADSGGAAVLDTGTSDKIDLILEGTGTTIPALIDGISSGGTDWTEEERAYILEQLALLTVSGASVVVTSGVYMCARGDVEQVYGNANTATWADLNNNQNSSEITSRINYHIVIADNYIRSVLTQGAWVMPVEGDTIPAILAYNCARLAGVLLYEGRGVTDYDPKGRAIHQLSNHKNGVDSFLKSVVYGSTDLSPLVKSSTNEAPTAS